VTMLSHIPSHVCCKVNLADNAVEVDTNFFRRVSAGATRASGSKDGEKDMCFFIGTRLSNLISLVLEKVGWS
jgi:hypothetical protein